MSWSSGGGGGGGTRDGKVGSKGDGEKHQSMTEVEGVDGNGSGGRNSSNGGALPPRHQNGAGGESGGSSRADGGQGGECSFKYAELITRIDASGTEGVRCPITSRVYGQGASSGPQQRGGNGAIIVIDARTKTQLVVRFEASKKEQTLHVTAAGISLA
jgi:hypothetical protein